VHAILADVPLQADGGDATRGEAVRRLAQAHARLLGAGDEEAAAAERIATTVLAHPLLRAAARTGGRVYREAPVTVVREDGMLIEGTVDLAYEADDGFVVIDFKTDRPEGELLARYRRQVGWYVAAIAGATGTPARGVLMLL
jgi:ATP-dependent exoDNAse (exonuclease V) beta subunit